MNWEFRSVTTTDSVALIKEYRQLAILAIDAWLNNFEPCAEVQPEGAFSEKPDGFFANGPWYRFRTTIYGPGGCLNPPEYDITVAQVFYPVFDKEVFEREMKKRLKAGRRRIFHAIE